MRNRWRYLLIATSFFAATTGINAQSDKKFTQTTKSETTRTIEVDSKKSEEKHTSVIKAEFTPVKPGEFTCKIIEAKVSITGPTSLEYDSQKDEGPLASYFKALLKKDLKVTVNKGKVQVSGIKELSWPDGVKSATAKWAIDNLITGGLGQFPDDAQEYSPPAFSIEMGKLGTLKVTTKAKVEKMDTIKIDRTIAYDKPGADAGFTVIPGKTEPAFSSSGTFKFDSARGWIESGDLGAKMTLELILKSAGGEEKTVKVTQTQSTITSTAKE